MLKSLSKKESKPKNMFSSNYKPKNDLVVKEEPKTAEKTDLEEKKERISQFMQFKKIEVELKKISKDSWQVEKARRAEEEAKKKAVEAAKAGDLNA